MAGLARSSVGQAIRSDARVMLSGVVTVMPSRIQRRRAKGWRMPENTVYVGRGSRWGNPFSVERYGRERAVQMFREYIGHPNSPLGFEPEDIARLRGQNLACWCREGECCHADVLLQLANGAPGGRGND